MAERRSGAGPKLSGVLERSTPHNQQQLAGRHRPGRARSPGTGDPNDAELSATSRGRGRRRRSPGPSTPAPPSGSGPDDLPTDDLFERILVQAHRRDRTISEYVAGILDARSPTTGSPAPTGRRVNRGRGGVGQGEWIRLLSRVITIGMTMAALSRHSGNLDGEPLQYSSSPPSARFIERCHHDYQHHTHPGPGTHP